MIKPITVNTEELMADGKSADGIGPFSKEELSQMLKSGIVDVYKDDTYVARMSVQDYEEYNRAFGIPVEDAAYQLLTTRKDELLEKYPGSGIRNIIGYVLARQLYDKK